MEEYHTGWAARAAQELDEQILSSGIEPVRLKCKIQAFLDLHCYCGDTKIKPQKQKQLKSRLLGRSKGEEIIIEL